MPRYLRIIKLKMSIYAVRRAKLYIYLEMIKKPKVIFA